MEWNNRTYCKDHIPDEAREATRRGTAAMTLSPSNRRTTKISARNAGAPGTKTPPPAASSGRRGGSTTKRRSASDVDSIEEMSPPKSQTPLIIGAIVVACVALGGVVVVMGMSGGKSGSSTDNPPSSIANQQPGGTTGNGGTASTPNTGNTGSTPNTPRNNAAADRVAQTEQHISKLLSDWGEYRTREKNMPPAEAAAKAEYIFDQAVSLVSNLKQLGSGAKIDRHKESELEELVQDAGRIAVQPFLDRLTTIKDRAVDDLNFDDARLQLNAALNGDDARLFPEKFRVVDYSLGQIRVLLSDLERERASVSNLSDAELRGLRAILPLYRRMEELKAGRDRSETVCREANDLLQRALSIANAHPAIYADAPSQDRITRRRTHATFEGLIDVIHDHLTMDFQQLNRNNSAAVQNWLDKASVVLNIRGVEKIEPITRMANTLRQGSSSTPTPTPGDGRTVPGVSLKAFVDEAQAAARSNDFTRCLVATAMLVLYFETHEFNDSALRGSHERTLLEVAGVVARILKNDRPRSGDPSVWRARAMLFVCVAAEVPPLKTLHDEINSLDDQFGGLDLAFFRAMHQLQTSMFAHLQPTDAQHEAFWDANYRIIRFGQNTANSVGQTNPNAARDVLGAINPGFQTMFGALLHREQTLRTRQRALKFAHQLRLVSETLIDRDAPGQAEFRGKISEWAQRGPQLPLAVAVQ